MHYSDVTSASWHLKTPATLQRDHLFTSMLRRSIDKNTKSSYHSPLVRKIHQRSVDSLHKGPVILKASPCHDVIQMLGWIVLTVNNHDDVIKWKPWFPRYWPFVGEFPGHRWIPPQRPVIFFLICAWINGWVYNREAGDLRRHRAHYDVIIVICTYADQFSHNAMMWWVGFVKIDHMYIQIWMNNKPSKITDWDT